MSDHFPIAAATLDAAGRIRTVNRAGAELLGAAQSELPGRELCALLAPAAREAVLRHLGEVLQPGRAERLTLDLDLPGNRALRLISAPVNGGGGRECLSVLLDVSEQRESLRRARESDALRQSVLDSLSAQIAVLDGAGTIIAVNRAWRRFAEDNGATPAVCEGVGINYFRICERAAGDGAEDGRLALQGVRGVIAGDLPSFSMEYPCPAPDRERWFLLAATPLEGGSRGAVVVHTDISRRKALERQDRRRREVMAHSARLHAVGILASSLVHELTQPLSAATFYIGAAVAMAREKGRDGDQIEVLDGVDAQIRRAGEIVHRLREFMRRRETNLGVVRLEEVIGHAMEFVHSLALDKRVQVFLDSGPGARPVTADAVQIEQVLVNLLCNAIQAVDVAGAEVREVRVRVSERAGTALVTVSDTGAGVPAARVERIFDVFETDKQGGMGMGLPISREIVEAHGGRLWAEADTRQGAVFRFTLPLHPEDSGT